MSSKGVATRERILDTAFLLAAREGIEGLSLGQLAGELGLSKSGLFAHFGSKEELQAATLLAAAERFKQSVVLPALLKPRGIPRIKALFDGWVKWAVSPQAPGGCIFVAAAVELDDREGPLRDLLVAQQRELLAALARAARIAIEERQLRKGLDVEQFAFELYSLMLGLNHARRLLREPKAEKRAREAFHRLIQSST